jgi:predicted amidohydrolase
MRKIINAACAQLASAKTAEKSVDKLLTTVQEQSDFDLIVFPEFYLSSIDKATLKRISQFVSELRVGVVFGAIEEEGGKRYDTAYFVDYDRVYKYRKTHVHWTESFEPGRSLDVFETSLGRVGMLVCYDSTFIETTRVLALKGAEIVVVVAAVPAVFDVKISLIRIQATAAENQVFIVYVNKPMSEMCSGNSMIVNPKGRVISSAGSVETVVTGVMNSRDLKEWREQEHIFPFRRPELYGALLEKPVAEEPGGSEDKFRKTSALRRKARKAQSAQAGNRSGPDNRTKLERKPADSAKAEAQQSDRSK